MVRRQIVEGITKAEQQSRRQGLGTLRSLVIRPATDIERLSEGLSKVCSFFGRAKPKNCTYKIPGWFTIGGVYWIFVAGRRRYFLGRGRHQFDSVFSAVHEESFTRRVAPSKNVAAQWAASARSPIHKWNVGSFSRLRSWPFPRDCCCNVYGV